jgi:hypothetical protein
VFSTCFGPFVRIRQEDVDPSILSISHRPARVRRSRQHSA